MVQYLPQANTFVHWKSLTNTGNTWLQATFNYAQHFEIVPHQAMVGEKAKIIFLQKILQQAYALNPAFWHTQNNEIQATIQLEFNAEWGLGSSSTLISCLAQWLAPLNAYELLAHTFGGSGYDVACATAAQPIVYQKNVSDNNLIFTPNINLVSFKPAYQQNLFFVYLNQKQNSQNAIKQHFKNQKYTHQITIDSLNQLTQQILTAPTLAVFEQLLVQHETLISEQLQMPTAQSLYFADYPFGIIKSLGAWGGDFVLATTNQPQNPQFLQYFSQKNYHTIIPYSQMILDF